MLDNIYVVEFLMRQKQERLENKARHFWMWSARIDRSKQPKQVLIVNPQTCCNAV